MNFSLNKLLILAALALPFSIAHSEDAKKEGFLPKVDKPISDTYEPLDGASWNHRTSEEIQTLREYQKQNQEKAESKRQLQLREELEAKIQAPDPGAVQPAPAPQVVESENRIQISDPE